MMRVAMLLMNRFTHDSRVHREASALGEAGHEVVVHALAGPGLAEAEDRGAYTVVRHRLTWPPREGRVLSPLVRFLEFSLVARAVAGEPRPDVIHAHDSQTLLGGWWASRRASAKLVYDAHELETGRNFAARRLAGIYRRLTVWPEAFYIRDVDAVITTSDGFADRLRETYGIDRPAVVRNCANFPPLPPSDHLREELGIAADVRIALYVGGVEVGRGLEVFLDAVERVDDTVAVVLGDGGGLARIRDAAPDRWSGAHFPGFVSMDDLPAFMASADVGVALIEPICESYRLCMPNKLFEYLQAGLPMVVSDLPCMGAFVREHGVGEAVDSADVSGVAAAIRKLLFDETARRAVIDCVRRVAPDHHWSVEKERLLAVYESIGAR